MNAPLPLRSPRHATCEVISDELIQRVFRAIENHHLIRLKHTEEMLGFPLLYPLKVTAPTLPHGYTLQSKWQQPTISHMLSELEGMEFEALMDLASEIARQKASEHAEFIATQIDSAFRVPSEKRVAALISQHGEPACVNYTFERNASPKPLEIQNHASCTAILARHDEEQRDRFECKRNIEAQTIEWYRGEE